MSIQRMHIYNQTSVSLPKTMFFRPKINKKKIDLEYLPVKLMFCKALFEYEFRLSNLGYCMGISCHQYLYCMFPGEDMADTGEWSVV